MTLSPILLLLPSFPLPCCLSLHSPACQPSCRSLPTAGEYSPPQTPCLQFSFDPYNHLEVGITIIHKLIQVKEAVQAHTASKCRAIGLESGIWSRGLLLDPELLTLTSDSALARSCQCGAWRAQETVVGKGSAPDPTAQKKWLCVSPHSPHPSSRLALGSGDKEEEMGPVLSFPPFPQAEQGHHILHHGADLCHQPLLRDHLPAQPPPPCLLRPCSPAGCGLPGPHHLPGTVGPEGALGMGEAKKGGNRWKALGEGDARGGEASQRSCSLPDSWSPFLQVWTCFLAQGATVLAHSSHRHFLYGLPEEEEERISG